MIGNQINSKWIERAVISFPNDLISDQFKFFDLTASLVGGGGGVYNEQTKTRAVRPSRDEEMERFEGHGLGVLNPLNVNSVLIDESNTTASWRSRPTNCVEAFRAWSTNYLVTGPDGQPRLGDHKSQACRGEGCLCVPRWMRPYGWRNGRWQALDGSWWFVYVYFSFSSPSWWTT
jgi:hypothetical protein